MQDFLRTSYSSIPYPYEHCITAAYFYWDMKLPAFTPSPRYCIRTMHQDLGYESIEDAMPYVTWTTLVRIRLISAKPCAEKIVDAIHAWRRRDAQGTAPRHLGIVCILPCRYMHAWKCVSAHSEHATRRNQDSPSPPPPPPSHHALWHSISMH